MNLYVRRLADELTDLGISVDVFTRRTDHSQPEIVYQPSGARVIHVEGGPARWLRKSVLPAHVPAMAAAMRSFARKHDLTYDLLHSHYWISGLAATRFRAGRAHPTPLIHMFHTLSKLKELHAGGSNGDDSAQRFEGERCLIGRANVVVGATEEEGEEMARLYRRAPAHYRVIPPGVDTELFRPRGRQESRDLLGISTEKIILFVGRLDSLKGVETLLRSVAGFSPEDRSNLKVLLVGGSEKKGSTSHYKRLVERLGLQNVVDFRGKVSQQDLPSYYSAADVCAMPSAYESFGIVALESMACQTPVVAFGVGGLSTTIQDARTGFLATPGDAAQFARRLRESLSTPNRELMGRRARMSIRDYSWKRCAELTAEMYEDVLEEYRYISQLRAAAN